MHLVIRAISRRPFPEALQARPARGQFISELSLGRKNYEILQLHPRQQPPPASHLHARHVVSQSPGAGALRRFQALRSRKIVSA